MQTIDFILNKCKGEESKVFYDKHKFYEIPNEGRNNLAVWLRELGFRKGAEIGVAAGEYSNILCRENPDMLLFGIDPYAPYAGYRDYTKENTFAHLENQARELLAKYPNYRFFKKFSTEAMEEFEDESLDFVYIDGNHSEPFVSQDIEGWYKKVRKGGILAGHDYARIRDNRNRGIGDKNWAVIWAIQRFTKENGIDPWFVIGTEAKVPGMIRDASRSWMIVK